MNRLTDEDIKEILAQLEGTEFDGTPIVLFAKEVQKLRKENEMLRKRVEVGESLYRNADCLQVNHLKICFQETEDCYCGLIDLDESCKKWRESGGGCEVP